MGGNALKEYGSTRLPSAAHAELSKKLETELNALMQKFGIKGQAGMIPSYREKADHGDIDVVLPVTLRAALSDQMIGLLLSMEFGTTEWPFKANGGVVSYGIPLKEGGVFQVDLIYLPEDEVEFAVKYFAWNDVGNLIGRIAHKMGLKFGHNGLHLPMRDGNHLFNTIVVTRNFDYALSFLGFDAVRWNQGFNNLEEIFNFVVANPRFTTKLYLLEERNHTARVRDKKRPTYTKFLTWLEAHPEKDSGYAWPEDKNAWLPKIFKAFPWTGVQWSVANDQLARVRQVQQRYNGIIVGTVTGLQGKALGNFMREFSSSIESTEGFQQWVLNTDSEEIKQRIAQFAKERG